MNYRHLLAISLLVGLAGCGSILGPNTTQPTGTQLPTSSTTVGTAQETEVTQEPIATNGTRYDARFPTARVLFNAPELPGSYELVGETRLNRSTASGPERESLNDLNARLYHEQAFQATGQDSPKLIFAAVTVFNSSAAADDWLTSHFSEIERQGGNVDIHSLGNGVKPHEARFKSKNNLRTVAYYEREANVVYYVAVADESAPEDAALQAYEAMLADVP